MQSECVQLNNFKFSQTFICALHLYFSSSVGEGYVLTRAALERLVPLFKCLPHFQPEDTWITGYLSDYLNVSRRWLPGTYSFFNDGQLSFARTLDYNRPALEKLLIVFSKFKNQHNSTLQTIKAQMQVIKNFSHYFAASDEWFEQQITSRPLHVNSVHLKLKAREIVCLWKKGITSEQLYIDFLLHNTWKSSKTFHDVLQRHAEHILPPIPVSKNQRRDLARFQCLG